MECPGSVIELENILRGHPEKVLPFARQAEDIKDWRKTNRTSPTTCLRNRLVLIEDPGYPIKRYCAATAPTAIEDTGVLRALFSEETRRDHRHRQTIRALSQAANSRGVVIKYI